LNPSRPSIVYIYIYIYVYSSTFLALDRTTVLSTCYFRFVTYFCRIRCVKIGVPAIARRVTRPDLSSRWCGQSSRYAQRTWRDDTSRIHIYTVRTKFGIGLLPPHRPNDVGFFFLINFFRTAIVTITRSSGRNFQQRAKWVPPRERCKASSSPRSVWRRRRRRLVQKRRSFLIITYSRDLSYSSWRTRLDKRPCANRIVRTRVYTN